ncbi:MAG TPA: ornithine carbamoyltransferase, partial [Candidatus Binatia bacterium]
MKKRDLLSIRDLERGDMERLLSLAARLKGEKGRAASRLLAGKTMALVFEKPSLRTRVSFEVGMMELGGRTLFLGPDEVQLGVRESPRDCSRVLSRWVDLIVVRTFAQETVEEMARFATVPVINALTDLYHPCQVLADCLTILEHGKRLEKLKVAFVGDGNNIVHSWMLAAEKIPFTFSLACPEGYEPDPEVTRSARENGA